MKGCAQFVFTVLPFGGAADGCILAPAPVSRASAVSAARFFNRTVLWLRGMVLLGPMPPFLPGPCGWFSNPARVAGRSDALPVQSDELLDRSDKPLVRSDELSVQSDELLVRSDALSVRSDELLVESDRLLVQADERRVSRVFHGVFAKLQSKHPKIRRK
ncbi:MAG: hypothetical protein NT105_18925 [Verrucomicrobia bacterium]|nr:hypothetical protein [Verrucomicrobiota bacterium]